MKDSPSKKLLKNEIDGKVIEDSLGRKLYLRQPNMVDHFRLYKALGNTADIKNCAAMAMNILYVARLDDTVFTTPATEDEALAYLNKLGFEGVEALGDFLEKTQNRLSQEEIIEAIKK